MKMWMNIAFFNTLLFSIVLSADMDIDVTPFVPPSVCHTCRGEVNNTECNEDNVTTCATGESCQNTVIDSYVFGRHVHMIYKGCVGFYFCSYGAGLGCRTNITTNTTTCLYCCIGELCNANEGVALVVPDFLEIIYQTLIYPHVERQYILNIVFGVLAVLCLLSATMGIALYGLGSKTAPFIHINLCIAMILSQVSFTIRSSGAGTTKQGGCKMLAFWNQYFYLVGACLFTMEGVHLLVIAARNVGSVWKKWQMLLIGWGLPFIVSGIALKFSFRGYGMPSELQKYCWFSVELGTWWGVYVPIIIVQLFGIVCVITVGVLHKKVKDGSDDEQYKKFRSNFVAFAVVLVVYIATWLFAFMELNPFFTKMPYFFIISHALLGIVVSLLYCAFNHEVRQVLKVQISPN